MLSAAEAGVVSAERVRMFFSETEQTRTQIYCYNVCIKSFNFTDKHGFPESSISIAISRVNVTVYLTSGFINKFSNNYYLCKTDYHQGE